MNSEMRKKLVDHFINFVYKSSDSELSSFLEYLQEENITKTLTGSVLAAFISGYTFGLTRKEINYINTVEGDGGREDNYDKP
jgi:hypothetical protein